MNVYIVSVQVTCNGVTTHDEYPVNADSISDATERETATCVRLSQRQAKFTITGVRLAA